MSEDADSNESRQPDEGEPQKPSSDEVRHVPVSARVPEDVGRGVFATGNTIQQRDDTFVIDFVSMMAHPQQLAVRVVLPSATFSQFVSALRSNLGRYEEQFGPAQPHKPVSGAKTEKPGAQPVDSADFYDQLKLPDEMLSGSFANVVMIRHAPEEFCFDFISNFFPRSVVTSRVYLAAGRVRSLLDSMAVVLDRYQKGKDDPGPPPERAS